MDPSNSIFSHLSNNIGDSVIVHRGRHHRRQALRRRASATGPSCAARRHQQDERRPTAQNEGGHKRSGDSFRRPRRPLPDSVLGKPLSAPRAVLQASSPVGPTERSVRGTLVLLAAPLLSIGILVAQIGDLLAPSRHTRVRVSLLHGDVDPLVLADDQSSLAESEDNHMCDWLQGLDHRNQRQLKYRVLGCIHQHAVKPNIRCAEFEVGKRWGGRPSRRHRNVPGWRCC